MELSSDVLEFIRLLNQNKVEYLVVGGWAVAFHGWPRYTKDIDVLIGISSDNAQKLKKVLDDFGLGDLDISEQDLRRPNFIIQLGFEPNRIDLLTGIPSVTFEDAYSKREQILLKDTTITFISRDDLIRNKTAAGRDQDLVDVKILSKPKK